jgi:dual specificity tyrosine-phosphorylation-regulated kinase 2/3/4
MSKGIIKLKLDLNENRTISKKITHISSTPRTTVHKSFDKSGIVSKIIPKLPVSTLHSRESSALLSSSRKKFESNRILKENTFINTSKCFTAKRNSISKELASTEATKLPLTPLMVLKLYKTHLTLWEQEEIYEFPEVYFYGQKQNKIKINVGNNNGFDDERNDYKVRIGDQIAYRYEIIHQLGKGSFGQVFKVFDHKQKEIVALKIIRNKPRFHQQGAVEVKVLKTLKDHDTDDKNHVIHYKQYFCFREHLCITFELLSINLYEFIKSNSFNGLSLPLIKRFTLQLLQGLKLSGSLNIIHCDLKPENILLKQSNKSCVKIIDFGSACFSDKKIFSYIQSRFYRAPEIIFGINYSTAIDMWSLGCILVELYTGVPLFPGENEHDQLLCIMEVRGLPPSSLIKAGPRSKLFFDEEGRPKIVQNSRGRKRYPSSKSLQDILSGTDKLYQDFVIKCLDWNPNTRLTPDQGLLHAWMEESLKPAEIPKKSIELSSGKFKPPDLNSTAKHIKATSFLFNTQGSI